MWLAINMFIIITVVFFTDWTIWVLFVGLRKKLCLTKEVQLDCFFSMHLLSLFENGFVNDVSFSTMLFSRCLIRRRRYSTDCLDCTRGLFYRVELDLAWTLGRMQCALTIWCCHYYFLIRIYAKCSLPCT